MSFLGMPNGVDDFLLDEVSFNVETFLRYMLRGIVVGTIGRWLYEFSTRQVQVDTAFQHRLAGRLNTRTFGPIARDLRDRMTVVQLSDRTGETIQMERVFQFYHGIHPDHLALLARVEHAAQNDRCAAAAA